MASRIVSPGATKWLEWGQLSDQPGSLVRDAGGLKVFTGSLVFLSLDAWGRRGVVVSLLAQDLIGVRWDGVEDVVELSPKLVRVVSS